MQQAGWGMEGGPGDVECSSLQGCEEARKRPARGWSELPAPGCVTGLSVPFHEMGVTTEEKTLIRARQSGQADSHC